jgi:hypothetical protein
MNAPPDTPAPAHVPRLIRPFRHPCGSVHRLVRAVIAYGLILFDGMCAFVTWLIEHPWANVALMLWWTLVFMQGTRIVREAFPPPLPWGQMMTRLLIALYLFAGPVSAILHYGG